MPKHSERKKQRFCCIYCGRRLWRLGNPKNDLDDPEVSDKRDLTRSRKNTSFLTTKGV